MRCIDCMNFLTTTLTKRTVDKFFSEHAIDMGKVVVMKHLKKEGFAEVAWCRHHRTLHDMYIMSAGLDRIKTRGCNAFDDANEEIENEK